MYSLGAAYDMTDLHYKIMLWYIGSESQKVAGD